MPQLEDGGHHALAGYLFQILGSAGLAAESLGQLSDDDAGISASFSVVKLESHGQDAELISVEDDAQRTRRLVQYKYSGTPAKYPIQPNQLIEILESFRQSDLRANEVEPLPTTFLLVSNRQLSESAKKVFDAGKSGQPCEQLDAVEEIHNRKKRHEGRTRANNAKYRVILKGLTFELVDEEYYQQVIARRAAGFGMLNSELPEGINRLIAAFFGRAASVGNRKITAPELDRLLVGYQNPRRLNDGSLRQHLLNGIAAKKRFLQLPNLTLRARITQIMNLRLLAPDPLKCPPH